MSGSIDNLADSIRRAGSPVCVGLDPDADRMPSDFARTHHDEDPQSLAAQAEAFCTSVIDIVSGVAPAVKVQAACFERFGSAGFAAMERVVRAARDADLYVVLDAKRGDIGVSARHYAAMAVGVGADAITINTYLGVETAQPYLDEGLVVFPLVRTSNPGSDAFQTARTREGTTVAELMAEQVADLGASRLGGYGLSQVGAVVGLTKSDDAERLRQLMPAQVFLAPGYGTQGGSADQLRSMLRLARTGGHDAGALVAASRSVLYPDIEPPHTWQDAVHHAARTFAQDVAAVTG
jgi:orotidine-5'-phosphate decarboxylase